MINNNMLIMPKTYEELTHQAKRIMQCKKLLPSEKRNYTIPEVEAIIQIGQAYGLSPWQSVQAIMIVNGQASVWGDFLIGLIWASGKVKEIKEYSKGSISKGDYVAVCEAKRGSSTIVRKFSIADAKKAGLWGKGPIWKGYPKRMLQMRARSWALRDGFGDVTKGLIAVEEAVDYNPMDDDTSPNIVEKEIIKTISESPKQPEIVNGAAVDKKVDAADELTSRTREAFLEGDLGYEDEDIQQILYDFLASQKRPFAEVVERALGNFDTFFKLLIADLKEKEEELKDD